MSHTTKFSENKNAYPCCIALKNPTDQILSPYIINEIIIPQNKLPMPSIRVEDLTNKVLVCQGHFRRKTWHILSQFLYFSPMHDGFVVPIATSRSTLLPMDEFLDNIQVMEAEKICQWKQGDT